MPTGTPLRNMLTDKDVRNIRRMARGGRFDYRDIADEFGIGVGSVSRIVKGRIFAHLGGAFQQDRALTNTLRELYGFGVSEEERDEARAKLGADGCRFALMHSKAGRSLEWCAKMLGVAPSLVMHAIAPANPKVEVDPETGKYNPNARMTIEQVKWARRRKMGGKTIAWIANECGVSEWVARDAISGATWAFLPGAIPPMRDGRGYSRTSLTAAGVKEIRRRFANEDVSKKQLAREYGVSPKHIRDILKMRVWANA